MVDKNFEEKVKSLNRTLAAEVTTIEVLIELAEDARQAILVRNLELFGKIVTEKDSMVKKISNINEKITEVLKLTQEAKGKLAVEVKDDFLKTVEKIDTLLGKWGEMEKDNMCLAQTYRISLEKGIGTVKKSKNITTVYRAQKSSKKSSKKFDQEM